ncbi:MAG: ankyrin repeat domain-containing protein, partial [Planctomycetes bacterium]|nr:ankyrin repeat domain-containing protein [Planctomycetota bacterium]
ALTSAACVGRMDVVKALVSAGADVDIPDKSGGTALMWAVNGSHEEVARYLMRCGADVNAQDSGGNNVLILAIGRLKLQTVSEIARKTHDINQKGTVGCTAVTIARKLRLAALCRLLKEEFGAT